MNMYDLAQNALLFQRPDLKMEIKIAYNKLKDKPVPSKLEEAIDEFYKEMKISMPNIR
jgi:hypothetical protein